MLEATGPTVRLNNAKGQQRLRLHVGANDMTSMLFMGTGGSPRIMLAIDHDRPHVMIFPRGARNRSVVAAVPFGKTGEPRAWSRARRAARANKRAAFEGAALDAGFLTPELPELWNFVRRKVRRASKRRAA
jgi:hypothetical protein